MEFYYGTVLILKFLVDFLMLVCASRLCSYPFGWKRAAIAAAFGAVYAGLCMIPRLGFMGSMICRFAVLLLMSLIAYGFCRSTLRRGAVFALLNMVLSGISLGMGSETLWPKAASVGIVLLICLVGVRNRIGYVGYVPVELIYKDRHLFLTALQDTGNTLFDPVTGRPVLVVCAKTAQKLTGLTEKQLKDPVSVMKKPPLPGLRLIPYRSVGQPCGLLLALRLQQVKIGSWRGSLLVAFAPDMLCSDGAYQALTGGTL